MQLAASAAVALGLWLAAVPVQAQDAGAGTGSALPAPSANAAPAHSPDPLFGRAGEPSKVTRVVTIDLRDARRLSPRAVVIRRGKTVRFVVRNRGEQAHALILGTEAELREHSDYLKQASDMQHPHPNIAVVQPGERGQIVWQFTRPGHFRLACLLPGHAAAEMSSTVVVR